MTDPTGRQLRARYAFAGAAVELDRTLPLTAGERLVRQGAIRLHGFGRLPRPAILRLTTTRLAVIAHYATRSDQVWELPQNSVLGFEVRTQRLQISWLAEDGRTSVLAVAAWTGGRALAEPIRDIATLASTLQSWLAR